MDTEKIASEAATNLVFSQEKAGEPKITRTICARKTINKKATGSDQNMICLAVFFKWFLNVVMSPAPKDFAMVGKAATAYDNPVMPRGTDCKFNDYVKIEI